MVKQELTQQQKLRKQIRDELFPLVPRKAGWRSPEFVELNKTASYRGRPNQWVAGYSHSRMYAHHMSGSTTRRILGWGDTPEAAIKMMGERLHRLFP